jgi:hypothetical protein
MIGARADQPIDRGDLSASFRPRRLAPWQHPQQQNSASWQSCAQHQENLPYTLGYNVGPSIAADVVCPDQEHYKFGLLAVEIAVLDAPEHMLGSVAVHTGIQRIELREMLIP